MTSTLYNPIIPRFGNDPKPTVWGFVQWPQYGVSLKLDKSPTNLGYKMRQISELGPHLALPDDSSVEKMPGASGLLRPTSPGDTFLGRALESLMALSKLTVIFLI